MVKYSTMKFVAAIVFIMTAAVAGANWRTVVPSLPESPYADGETSTNIVIRPYGGIVNGIDVGLTCMGTPSNCVQVAFGRDDDGDGVLGPDESALIVGWRAGRCFVEDVHGMNRMESPLDGLCAMRDVAFKVMTDNNGVPRTCTFVCGGEQLFAELSSSPIPRWGFDAGWNMLRVTRRGEGSDSDQAECIVRHGFLYISVR